MTATMMSFRRSGGQIIEQQIGNRAGLGRPVGFVPLDAVELEEPNRCHGGSIMSVFAALLDTKT